MGEENIFKKVIELIPFEKLIESGVNGYIDMANNFGRNYSKRRQVGFTIGESIMGGFDETKSYMHCKWTGQTFKEMVPAFEYVDGIERNGKN